MKDISAHAWELHRRAVVIDGHSDILMALADGTTRLGSQLAVPDPSNWVSPFPPLEATEVPPGPLTPTQHTLCFGSAGQYSIPQFVAGGITVQVCAIYIDDKYLGCALQRGLEMAWWLHHEVRANPGFELVRQAVDIPRLKQEGKTGAILSLEGLEALGNDLRFLDIYAQLGLRMASLTHNRRNLFADGPQPGVRTGGLTELGRQAICRMNELGIVVDLVHTNETCFWEILELVKAPVAISHLSPYAFARWRGEPWPCPRFNPHQDRAALEAVARNGGVVGLIYFGFETIDAVVENIEHLLELIGPDHVGLGSDFWGAQFAPRGLEEISQVPRLTDRLVARGHADEIVLKLLGGNFLRLFQQAWTDPRVGGSR
ncbi:MAG: dipeptidase [Acidobacteria bacterium]|nr:dipeptidase [Acidobacteriota bacterium]